jgi:Coenzyme PQQ synthesis protein D (PqqD)
VATPAPTGDSPLRVNRPTVVAEVVEGEVILINLETGNYYSLGGSGAVVWELVDTGRDREQLLAAAEASFEGEPTAIRESVADLVDQLVAEGLVVADEAAPGTAPAATNGTSPAPANRAAHERVPFEAPALGKYTDMQEFILLDPIHDIAEAGWPQPAQG